MVNARSLAVEILGSVLKGRFVEDCLADERISTLSQRDKNFMCAMLYATLRHMGEIDHFLHRLAKKRDNGLRLAVAQMKIMEMQPYAVVNEMVNITERKAYTNAILRKCAEKEFERNPKLNFPGWIYGAWKKAYGAEKTAAIAEISLTEPPLDITVKEALRSKVIGDYFPSDLGPMTLPNGSIRLIKAGNVSELKGYEEGEWWVQDASSTYAVEMLGDVAGKNVLDMCAAPGGKTAQLLDRGAVVTALDDSPRRIKILEQNLQRLKFTAEIICEDGRSFAGREFDLILIDAPCTATGTIRRNPEILHQRIEADLKNLVKTQTALIDNAHNLLKKDGVLVYSVCSLQYEEGEGLIKKLETGKWKLEGEKRILPCDWAEFGGIGGSFAAKLKKL